MVIYEMLSIAGNPTDLGFQSIGVRPLNPDVFTQLSNREYKYS